ncbi:MAG: DNA primase [Bacilli bacterium]|nr:DNA primase [Bacilli bacterium]
MSRINSDMLTKIKESVNIVDVISEYISLTPRGKNYFGICPFHDDNNPSMSVSQEKGIYKCFSCGATGNVFKFVQDFEKISFKEAVAIVAKKAGIEIDIGTIKKSQTYPKLHEIYNLSLKFYTNNINTKEGKEAKEYLKKRSIDDKLIKEFQIGLSLSNKLSDILNKKYEKSDILKTGLVYETNYGYNDLYHDRIMFPLYDLNGNVVAYSGRKYHQKDLDNNELPKYINTKETEIFKKGELLYNYHNAKNIARQKNQIIVMEGFMDVIRAHSIDIKNTIATMGTAVTSYQANLIKKMAKEIILCFDGDEAGNKATLACGDELIKLGISPKVIRLEENLDPDEYILKKGEKAFKLKIENATSFVSFKLANIKNKYKLSDPDELANYINEIINELNKIDDDILKNILIKQIVKDVDIDESLINNKLNVAKNPQKRIRRENTKKQNRYEIAQRNLLYHMLEHKEVIKMYNNKVTFMPKKEYRILAREISLFLKDNGYINISDLIDYIEGDEEISNTINEVQKANLKQSYTNEEIADYIKVIKEYNIKTETKRLKEEIMEEIDPTKKAIIAQKIIDLKKGV